MNQHLIDRLAEEWAQLDHTDPLRGLISDAIAEINKQPAQQEPVAYAVYHRMGGGKSLHWPEQHSPNGDANEYQLVPLYTSPPAQRKENT